VVLSEWSTAVQQALARHLRRCGYGNLQLPLGGRTGTGDNRITANDRQRSPRPVPRYERTGDLFVFFSRDDHFGTVLTAFVPGKAAGMGFRFNLGHCLWQVLKVMAPNTAKLFTAGFIGL